MAALPPTLPGLIGRLGRQLVTVLNPWAQQGHGAACDSTAVRAHGGVWHKKDREAGVGPPTSIDIEAHWSKSGWHGWWYGWKLHLAVSIGRYWLPLAAEGPIRIPIAGSKSGGCSINCARTPLNPSMACLRTSLRGADRCRSKACPFTSQT